MTPSESQEIAELKEMDTLLLNLYQLSKAAQFKGEFSLGAIIYQGNAALPGHHEHESTLLERIATIGHVKVSRATIPYYGLTKPGKYFVEDGNSYVKEYRKKKWQRFWSDKFEKVNKFAGLLASVAADISVIYTYVQGQEIDELKARIKALEKSQQTKVPGNSNLSPTLGTEANKKHN